MERGFLELESQLGNKRIRKTALILFVVEACIFTVLYFALRKSIDMSDNRTRILVVGFFAVIVIMVGLTLFMLILSGRTATEGKNLILPFNEDTKEAVGKIINREVAEGKILAEGSMNNYEEGKKKGARVILIPSYLMITEGMGKITAIPRDKIYWICAQTGYKGGPFYVRLLIFTEMKIFETDGNDIEHTKGIAERLYQYIPNVFEKYDSPDLPYLMEEIYNKDKSEFLKFYEEEKIKL
jgi:heme/copper-type cytochrome/quinol oxidase subunit 4